MLTKKMIENWKAR